MLIFILHRVRILGEIVWEIPKDTRNKTLQNIDLNCIIIVKLLFFKGVW